MFYYAVHNLMTTTGNCKFRKTLKCTMDFFRQFSSLFTDAVSFLSCLDFQILQSVISYWKLFLKKHATQDDFMNVISIKIITFSMLRGDLTRDFWNTISLLFKGLFTHSKTHLKHDPRENFCVIMSAYIVLCL